MSSLQLASRAARWRRLAPVRATGQAGSQVADHAIRSPRRARAVARLALRLPLALALLALAAALGLLVARAAYGDRVYPGITVAGVELGGLARDAAGQAVAARAEALGTGLVTFTHGERRWTPTLAELGVGFDVDASVDAAFALGREPVARDRLASARDLARGDVTAPLRVTLNEAALGRWLDGVDAELGQPARDAELIVDGARVTLVESHDGVAVDRAAATQAIMAAVGALQPAVAPLPLTTMLPAVRAADLKPTYQVVSAALAAPVEVAVGTRSWTVEPADVASFFVQRATPGADGLYVEVDRAGLATWLNERFGRAVNRNPRDATLGWDGKLVALTESREGRTLQPEAFADAVVASLLGDHAPVAIPAEVAQPAISSANLDAFGIVAQLGEGTSNYEGSEESRAINVAVGAELLDSTLVPPGEIFSFNHAIGEITEELGYVESNVIDGERVGRDIGGGICQVSTTVFRAAWFAGLPIVEGWPHRYRLGFYEQDGWEPGLDASIIQPEGDPFGAGDFRFRNPTDSWLLIQSYTDGARIYVTIYGPDLDYTVQVDGPNMSDPIPPTPDVEVVDWEAEPGTLLHTELPQEGLETRYIRTVFDRDGNVVLSDDWYTKFEPRGNVYKVSPDMQGQSPATNPQA